MLNNSLFIVSLLAQFAQYHSHFQSLSLFCIRTPQHKTSPESSSGSTPTNEAPQSYDEQLRLAMELSAREQEEAELRQRQEEEELQRIIQLSLMEKWQESEQAKIKGQESICSKSLLRPAILSPPMFSLSSSSSSSSRLEAQGSNNPPVTEIWLCPLFYKFTTTSYSTRWQSSDRHQTQIELFSKHVLWVFFSRQISRTHSYVRDRSISHQAIYYPEFLEHHSHWDSSPPTEYPGRGVYKTVFLKNGIG